MKPSVVFTPSGPASALTLSNNDLPSKINVKDPAVVEPLKARMQAQEAVDLYHRGLISEAASKFESAEALDPYIPTIQLNLGFAQLALYQANPKGEDGAKAAAKAITAFERYLSLKPVS